MALARPGQSRFQAPWLLPVGALAAVVAALAGIVWVSGHVGGDDLPPEAPAFQPPPTSLGYERFTVKQVGAGRVEVVAETAPGQPAPPSKELVLADGAAVEALVRIQPEALRPGEPIVVIGIPNEVRNFSIHGLVAFEQPAPPDADLIVRSPVGFGGFEAAADGRDRVILTGTVVAFDGKVLRIDGPTGQTDLTLTPGAPLYRLHAAAPDDIREGDRIATVGDTTVTAVLIGTPR